MGSQHIDPSFVSLVGLSLQQHQDPSCDTLLHQVIETSVSLASRLQIVLEAV